MKLPGIRPNVITTYDAKKDPAVEDSNLAKIIGYIPGEVVATYVGITNLIMQLTLTKEGLETSLWVFACVFLVATPFYVLVFPKDRNQAKPSLIFHAIYATIAYMVWVFALGGPFEACCKLVTDQGKIVEGWWQSGWGGIAILVVTFLSPFFEKGYFWVYSKIKKAG